MEEFSDCVFYYDEEKERWLQKERGLSFDVIAEHMRNGKCVDVLDDASADYPDKKLALMEIEEYIVVVPYVRKGDDVFLRTAFKSRKANKKYKGGKYHGSQKKSSGLH